MVDQGGPLIHCTNTLHTWPNSRFVQIQDGLGSKEMLAAMKGVHIP